MHFCRRAHLVQRLTLETHKHGEFVAVFLKAQPFWRVDVELDALRCCALRVAELQRSQAHSMLRRVSVCAVGIEGLAEDENSLAMLAVRAGLLRKINVGCKRNVA